MTYVPHLQECHDMFLDGSQLVVDYEAERLLPGWVPRRLGRSHLHCQPVYTV